MQLLFVPSIREPAGATSGGCRESGNGWSLLPHLIFSSSQTGDHDPQGEGARWADRRVAAPSPTATHSKDEKAKPTYGLCKCCSEMMPPKAAQVKSGRAQRRGREKERRAESEGQQKKWFQNRPFKCRNSFCTVPNFNCNVCKVN